MACNIEEALDKLNTLMEQSEGDVKEKLKSLQLVIFQKRPPQKGGNGKEKLSAKYNRVMTTLVRDLLGPKVTTSQMLAFSKATLQNLVTVAGEYKNKTVTISVTPNQDAYEAMAKGLYEEWYTEESPYAVKYQKLDPEEFAIAVANDKRLQETFKAGKDDIIASMKVAITEMKGVHSFAHEMVHAGSREFMAKYPQHAATKRMQELYQMALDKEDGIMAYMGEGVNGYWKTSIDEFIAEGLSNPSLVKALNKIKTGSKGRLSSILKDMVETLLSMLGFRYEDTVYNYLLDGYMAMLESQAPNTEEIAKVMDKVTQMYNKAEANNKLDRIQNTTQSEVAAEDISSLLCD